MTSISKRILIVDDEEDLTWSISRSLRKESGKFEVICVNSGDEAIQFLNRISFDLLLSDIRMPGKNGFTLLNYVKKHFPQLKVIIMSAWYGPEVRAIVEKTTGISYIEKPFEIQYLKDVIYKAFRNGSSAFKNRFVDMSLRDIIAYNCQHKFNGTINITNGKKNGIIHFRSGEVIHVQVGDLEGESAFVDVLNWHDFEYDTELTDEPIKETINSDWKMLLEKSSSED